MVPKEGLGIYISQSGSEIHAHEYFITPGTSGLLALSLTNTIYHRNALFNTVKIEPCHHENYHLEYVHGPYTPGKHF